MWKCGAWAGLWDNTEESVCRLVPDVIQELHIISHLCLPFATPNTPTPSHIPQFNVIAAHKRKEQSTKAENTTKITVICSMDNMESDRLGDAQVDDMTEHIKEEWMMTLLLTRTHSGKRRSRSMSICIYVRN